MPPLLLLAALCLCAPASIFAGLFYGSAELSPQQIWHALLAPDAGTIGAIVWQLRLPRVLGAFACGALLALAGTLLQALLRNPLADPYILGISGGASLGALAAMMLGLGFAAANLAALLGALAVLAAVFLLSFRAAQWDMYRLLLTGVVLSSGCGAVISLILTLAPQAMVKGMLFWLMGDLSHAGQVLPAWGVLAAAAAFGLTQAQGLNVLSLGALKAKSLGVAVTPLQAGVYFCAALATVAAVMLGGAIGFVGLLVPHAVRMLGVSDHRWLLPLALLLGGTFLTAADTLARTAWAPAQIPVGVLTALLGAPALLLLLARRS